MLDLNMQIRVGDKDAFEFIVIPMWRGTCGCPMIPRQGETFVHQGKTYNVIEVVWNRDNDSIIAYVDEMTEKLKQAYLEAAEEMRNYSPMILQASGEPRFTDEDVSRASRKAPGSVF
jgi:hypothetical protein